MSIQPPPFSLSPKSNRKDLIFFYFQGVHKGDIDLKWVEESADRLKYRLSVANIGLFKFINISTRKRFEIRSKLTIKTPERCQ